MDPVKMPRLDEKKLQTGRQNPIQFSKSNYRGKMKIFERTSRLVESPRSFVPAYARQATGLYPECCSARSVYNLIR
jgi:hypothetical protein